MEDSNFDVEKYMRKCERAQRDMVKFLLQKYSGYLLGKLSAAEVGEETLKAVRDYLAVIVVDTTDLS